MIGFQDLYRIFFQILWRLLYNSMGDLSDYALPFVFISFIQANQHLGIIEQYLLISFVSK